MKKLHLMLCLSCALLAPLAQAGTSTKRVASLIKSADHVIIHQDLNPKDEKTVVINDAEWIRAIGAAIASARLGKHVHCLCSGYRTGHFYVGDEQVASVAAIHEHQLRLYWKGGGGDFPVDEATWNAVAAALVAPVKPAPAAVAEGSALPPQP